MASRFAELIVDCQEPRPLAEFWCAVVGHDVINDARKLLTARHLDAGSGVVLSGGIT